MASFAARRSPSALWTIKECAHFAALKEFELLQLLSKDKKAFATARRLTVRKSSGPAGLKDLDSLCHRYVRLGWQRLPPAHHEIFGLAQHRLSRHSMDRTTGAGWCRRRGGLTSFPLYASRAPPL